MIRQAKIIKGSTQHDTSCQAYVSIAGHGHLKTYHQFIPSDATRIEVVLIVRMAIDRRRQGLLTANIVPLISLVSMLM
jgi:hypothetical protein